VKRRKALQNLGLGLSGAVLLPSIFGSCKREKELATLVKLDGNKFDGEVAIVGAGVCGLYLADILQTLGIRVKVYEASDQVGGRIKSLNFQSVSDYPNSPKMISDFPIELGAETIIGTNSIIGKIYQELRVPTTEFIPEKSLYILDNIAKTSSKWSSDPDFFAVMNFISQINQYTSSAKTVKQMATDNGITERGMQLLGSIIGNSYGADIDVLGIGLIGEEFKSRDGDAKILGLNSNSMQSLVISRFHSILPRIITGTKITSIDYSGKTINLLSSDGVAFQADLVVCTTPISILKNGNISFTPKLPSKFMASLDKFGMSPAIRVVLEFTTNFWGAEPPYIFGSPNFPEYFSCGVNRGELNRTLSTTIYGQRAEELSKEGVDIVSEIIKDLDSRFRGQATRYIRKDSSTLDINFILENWGKNPNILGCFSYPLAGATINDRKNLGEPIEDKLFFAGEATDVTGWAGTVNGALASAERVSALVTEVIKKL